MIVQHNLSAMNANRQFNLVNNSKAKSAEKLSSGYKINRAADDAAGLAISEKMRRQIRGLTQASLNCQDGISLVQVADGAMAEVHDILDRCTELSVKAANGTLSDDDREMIQREIAQLKDEMNAIQHKTTFNEIPVLTGGGTLTQGGAVKRGGLPGWVTSNGGAALGDGNYGDTKNITSPTTNNRYFELDFAGLTAANKADLLAEDSGFYTTCCTCDEHYSFKFVDKPGDTITSTKSGNHNIFEIPIGDVMTGADLAAKFTKISHPNNHYTHIEVDGSKITVYDERDKDNTNSFQGIKGPGIAYNADDPRVKADVIIQAGSENDPNQRIKIILPNVSCSVMKISSTNVSTQPAATKAIEEFKNAKEYVSGERSRMGAYQNRLEHTIKNLDNVVENTTAAESAIRDTDMALEMVKFANENILAQAGTSMLAQANQTNQNVLSLLG